MAAASILALVGGVGAAQAQGERQGAAPWQHATRAVPAGQVPPPIRLTGQGITLSVKPYTACWYDDNSGFCYDGIPPHPLPSLGGLWTSKVTLAFARDGWHFSVTATDSAGQQTRIKLTALSAREWRLGLGDLPTGRYRLDVFGRGPEGDVAMAGAFTLN